MEVISNEQARKEVFAFLDDKKIGPSKRKSYETQIDEIVEAAVVGDFAILENECLYKLKFPITSGDFPIAEFKLKKRLLAGEVKSFLKNVLPQDVDGRYIAYICALSGQPLGVVNKLDTEDLNLLRSYVAFFI